MEIPFKRKKAVRVGFGLALLIFLAISVVSYLNTEGFIRAQRQEKATLAVLYALVAHGVAQPVPLLLGFALLPFGILIAHLRFAAANGKG